jgi:hypothetical protein
VTVLLDDLLTADTAHGVELWTELDELADTVARFLVGGDRGVLVARSEHHETFVGTLEREGWGGRPLEVVDAEELLGRLLVDGTVSAAAFDEHVGGLIERVGGRPRIYGEMVDILSSRGETAAAIALEEEWNGLLRRRPFSLLCAYRLDPFSTTTQAGPAGEICRVHSHVLPAHDVERFVRAVDRALLDVLGPARTRDVYYIVTRPLRERRVPVAQDALRWVAENLPTKAEAVLAAARAAYAQA